MQNLEQWLEQTIEGLGFELVDLARSGRGLIQLFIDKSDGVTIDDCVLVSNHLTRLFAVESVDYDRLEVSSPGLDRVLKKPEHFVRFAGQQAKIKIRTMMPELGQHKQFVALLQGADQEAVLVSVDGVALRIDFANLDRVRLVPQVKG